MSKEHHDIVIQSNSSTPHEEDKKSNVALSNDKQIRFQLFTEEISFDDFLKGKKKSSKNTR